MSRVLLRAVVVEGDDDTISARIGVTDPHVAGCTRCMAVFALRLSSVFLKAIEDLKQEEEDDGDAPVERGCLH